MKLNKKLWERAKEIIPGGTQMYSKRPSRFCEGWPTYYSKAKGCEVWDLEGRHYYDFSSMGIGCCVLGYADDDVDNAVIESIRKGSMCTLNCPEEVELAEMLLKIHPWADMVRFAKTGGGACAMAVKIAQGYTDCQDVVYDDYHGWILKNDKSKGYDILITEIHPSIEHIIEYECRALIIDEVTTGFRMNLGGLHLEYGKTPDIAVFGKALGNGYPIAAVIGKRKFMEPYAFINPAIFISSTFWTERTGTVAAIATLKKMKKLNVFKHLIRQGQKIKDRLNIETKGIPPLLKIDSPQSYKKGMLKKGFLVGPELYLSYAHTEELVDRFIEESNKLL